MPINSRSKGKAGELELRDLLRKYGFEARRGQQFSGGGESPDVISSMTGFHHEVKRVETFNLYKAFDQAERDRKPDDVSLIWHRKNKRNWMVAMDAEAFLRLLVEYVFTETGA